jgi:hypothetical protein
MHYCQPDESIKPPVINIDFDTKTGRYFWCVPIVQLHNKSFDYSRGGKTFVAICKVVHTPMKWNFWHFSLRWKVDTEMLEDMEQKEKDKVAQKLGHSARVIIAHFARLEHPEHPVLPKNCYCKN